MTTQRSPFVVSPKRALQCAVLTFAVLAAPRIAAEVILNGIEGPPHDNVLAYLDLDEEPCDASELRVRQLYQAAMEDVVAALQGLGYYTPRITPALAFEPECWRATFDIELGEPVLIRTFDVAVVGAAADDPEFTKALEESGLAVGAQLHHGDYERLKRRWVEIALDRGYAEGRLSANRIDVYPDERAADVALRYESGPRYSFGPVEFEQDVLSDELIQAYVMFRPGDPYNNEALTDLYVVLAESGFFQVIDVRPLQPDSATRQIPIRVALTAAPRRLITYGIGYSTDTGPRLSIGRDNRRWNDRGHQFLINAQLSTVISEVTATYRFPFGDPGEEWISFDAGVRREDTESAESESLELGARRVVRTRSRWTRTQSLSLLVEDYEIADQVDRSRLLMPGIEWLRTPSDDVIAPREGTRLHLRVRGAADSLGSDTSFVQVFTEARRIWLLRNDSRFLVRSQVGHTWKDALTSLPASVRFFAGGDYSVRGYEFEELGPVDDTGQVIGGSSLVTASIEYEHPLRARWALAFFFDWGNAFEGDDIDARRSVGIGGRWLSPLGPIRLDLAHPLDDPTADDYRVHITLGPDL
jgi:translocation and assembly module TamA